MNKFLVLPLKCVPPIGDAFVQRKLGGFFRSDEVKSSPTGRVSHARLWYITTLRYVGVGIFTCIASGFLQVPR
jgi:hypothetical protein